MCQLTPRPEWKYEKLVQLPYVGQEVQGEGEVSLLGQVEGGVDVFVRGRGMHEV